LDLAGLVSGWSSEDRLSMCRAYYDSLPAERRAEMTLDGLRRAVDLCRLSLAIQWIGWPAGWRPPADHRTDWVGEASSLLCAAGLP
jgi:hypothetical protein